MKLVKVFIQYQQERFPLVVLLPTLATSVIGSSMVIQGMCNWNTWVALVGAVSFLLLIRVTDEIRDDDHDAMFHPERPVQRGAITLAQLKVIRSIAFVLFILMCFNFPKQGLISAALLLGYHFFTAHDFFIGHIIRKHFYFYNFINMLQLVILQCCIYTMIGWDFLLDQKITCHLIIIFMLSLILEIIRKIKLPEEETNGNDTYSYHMGFNGSVYFLIGISFLTLIPLGIILLQHQSFSHILFPLVVLVGLILASLRHIKFTKQKTANWLFSVSLLFYMTVNLTLLNL